MWNQKFLPTKFFGESYEHIDKEFEKIPDIENNRSDFNILSFKLSPGDVIAFDMLVYHAAYGGSQDRCQLTFSYLGLPRTHDEEIATQELSKAIVQVYRTTFAPKPHHHPNWLANPDGSLMRQHWVNKLLEWGIVD